ncbi:MAG TPA: shikimate dehydrogenase [Nitrosospira sp.]
MPDYYAVIGNPVAHSKSPWLHAEFSRQTGQDVRYDALLAPIDGFDIAVAHFRQRGGKGMNVTVPFKREAYAISHRLSERSRIARAVNTLTFVDDEILGDNTDGAGLIQDILGNLKFSITAKRVLLMGAGGAARGVLGPLLEQAPCMLAIANRTRGKADELRQQFSNSGNIASGDYADLRGERFDLIINATSASLHGQLPILPAGIFASGAMAYDMVYGDRRSIFLQFAQQEGASRLADGIGMLVEQAAESFFLWRGIRPVTKPVIEMLCPGRGSSSLSA